MTDNQPPKARTSGRMNTSMERTFRRDIHGRPGYFQEYWLHFINFSDENGKIMSSKLDKQIPTGMTWKTARPEGERSRSGECSYTFPGDKEPTLLVALGKE